MATTTLPEDDAITAECRRLGVRCFRGSEADVLDRYYHAAQSCKADLVVRITADCPLIDAGVIDKTIRAFLDNKPDYASNTLKRTYPRGLDTEVMTADALGAAWRDAALHYQRVHVTPYIYQNPQRFKLLSVTEDVDYSSYRWTLDVPEDLEFIQMIYQQLANNGDFCWRDVVELMERQPELVEINRFVPQKALQEG